MSPHAITLFMWGYQLYFRVQSEHLMNSVLNELGVTDAGVKCLLVGAKIPGATVRHDVCVEPENGEWPVALFAELPATIEEIVKTHPLQNTFYGDEPSMRDKPENMRRDSVRQAVQAALVSYDTIENVRSFVGFPAPVEGYHVVPVLQLLNSIFERFRPLREPVTDGQFTGRPSLIHASVRQVLNEAYDELLRPDPGRHLAGKWASPAEIVRRAAADFMNTPLIAIGDTSYGGPNLFESFNLISSLMYEGTEGRGRMLLSNLDSGAVEVALKLDTPVPFSEPRWARKVLQMASSETALLANCMSILGLGNISAGVDSWTTQNVFEVQFHDHYHWSLSCGDEVLLVSKYGAPSLPQERFPRVRLIDTYSRLFPEATKNDSDNITKIFDVAVAQNHGSMLVVAHDAIDESNRLSRQGTKVVPFKLTPELYCRVSNIDGTIIIDPHCVCHAVGVILDGPAKEACTPARGARYNSGIRYIGASKIPRLAVVISDDRTVDVFPILRPRIRRRILEEFIVKLEASTVDNYHSVISWLDGHRFYLDKLQSDRVNTALTRLHGEVTGDGAIWVQRKDFTPDPDCTADYFEPEEKKANE